MAAPLAGVVGPGGGVEIDISDFNVPEWARVDREQILNAMHTAQEALKVVTEVSGMAGRAALQTFSNLAGVPINMDKQLVNRDTVRETIATNYEAICQALNFPKWIPEKVGVLVLTTCLLVPGILGAEEGQKLVIAGDTAPVGVAILATGTETKEPPLIPIEKPNQIDETNWRQVTYGSVRIFDILDKDLAALKIVAEENKLRAITLVGMQKKALIFRTTEEADSLAKKAMQLTKKE